MRTQAETTREKNVFQKQKNYSWLSSIVRFIDARESKPSVHLVDVIRRVKGYVDSSVTIKLNEETFKRLLILVDEPRGTFDVEDVSETMQFVAKGIFGFRNAEYRDMLRETGVVPDDDSLGASGLMATTTKLMALRKKATHKIGGGRRV